MGVDRKSLKYGLNTNGLWNFIPKKMSLLQNSEANLLDVRLKKYGLNYYGFWNSLKKVKKISLS